MTNKNVTVSLSNEFIQQPQTPFTAVETKLFHVALLQIHQKEKAFKPLYCIQLDDIITKQGSNYALLAEAITSLKNRVWFGVPLFLTLEHVKGESVIEFTLNPLLSKHLLSLEGWFATIDVADLYNRGLKNPIAWRLLWILRSYWRPKAKHHDKKFTIAELETLFFAGEVPFSGFTRLKQHIGCAEKALVAAGVPVQMKSDKRGLIAKGLKFIIPDLKLKAKKSKLKEAIEAAGEAISNTVTQVVAEVQKVAVIAPVAAALAVAPAVVEAAPVAARTTATPTGNLGSYIQAVVNQASANRTAAALPSNTLAVVGLSPRAATPGQQHQDMYTQLYTVLERKWQLDKWQIGLIRDYVAGNSARYELVRSVIRVLNVQGTDSAKSLGAVVWTAMKNDIPLLQDMYNKKYSKA